MITSEEYQNIISELLDELPEEFFRELSGGVVLSEALVIPDYARDNDLFTMGQYQVYSEVLLTVRIRRRAGQRPRSSCAAFSAMNSGIIWNFWEESTIRLPWKPRMNEGNGSICSITKPERLKMMMAGQ